MSLTNPIDAFSLEGKVILVTGASSGIGAASAKLLAQLGAKLVINGRNAERLEATFQALSGDGHFKVVGDLTEPDVRQRLIEVSDGYDGLAACAGVSALVPLRMASEKHLQLMLAVNYLAPVTLTQQLLHKRRLRPNASLVFITTVGARSCPQATAGYAASKAALEAAARTLALEQARQGIRVNCVAPGYVDTPMLSELGSAVNMEGNMALTPLGNIVPEDIAQGVAYLLSGASRWITRSTLTIDGGITLPVRI